MLRSASIIDQTARISLQISINVKERGDKINRHRLNPLGRYLPTVSPKFPSPSVPCEPFRRPVAVCSASVRRYLRITPGSRKCLFQKTFAFLRQINQHTEIAQLSTQPQMHPTHAKPAQGRILRKSPTHAKPPARHAPRAPHKPNRVTNEMNEIGQP